MIPFAMSLDRDEGVFSARLRVNRMEAFERPTPSKASKVVVTKTKMASRGVVGKSQLWCRKLDTRTSRYESSVGTRVCWGWSPGSDRGPSSGWVWPSGRRGLCRPGALSSVGWSSRRRGCCDRCGCRAWVFGIRMGSEVRGVGLVRPGRGVHRGGSGAFLHLERAQSGFALPNLLF